MFKQNKTTLPGETRLQTVQTKHPEWREASALLKSFETKILKETNPVLIPYNYGLKILTNVSRYLETGHYSHLSWTWTFFKYLEAKEKLKEHEEKEKCQ